MPRSYDMSRRAASREATRQRIVEATAKLHGERGVFGTSWRDIAEEADVSVATVYAHFPSLDELLPACGAHVMRRIRPPQAEDAAEIIGEATAARERLARVARALHEYYERGGPHIEVDVRERQLPGMREWEQSQRDTVEALIKAALGDPRPRGRALREICALFDLPTFKAFEARGVATAAISAAVTDAAVALTERDTTTAGRRR